MLNIEDLNQFYGGSHILRQVQLQLKEGQCTCLLGRNGVGKTTLLKAIMGLLPIASGKIYFNNQPIMRLLPEQRARLGIGYVPQGREIFPLLTVEENLQVALAGRSGKKQIPKEIYQLFPVLQEMRQRRGGDLSGGQQQQLAIGRALVLSPKILLLDEPTEGIQPNIVQSIGQVIQHLTQVIGITVLLVEQKLPFAKQVAKQMLLLERGEVVLTGSIADLDDAVITRYLQV